MSIKSITEQYKDTKTMLDSVSSSFCLAKWYQVTLHLQNGQNHSCHHPNTHQPTIEELEKNPDALHNSNEKKIYRKMMMEGVRPKECEYCWKIEDTPGEHFSDRQVKSNDDWAKPFFADAKTASYEQHVNPKYLEVSFSNSCNFKCVYCLPHISSSWMKELKQFGNIQTFSKHHTIPIKEKMPITNSSENPYVGYFWKWWPNLYPDLKVLRITGGEPLMVPDTFKLLDWVSKNPNKDLSLAINSNLGVEFKLIEKASEYIKSALDNKYVKEITIYTSLDTWGKQAEYIRTGLDLNLFLKNFEYILNELPEVKISFMCTYNLLSIPSFREFLQFILDCKNKYKNTQGHPRVILDISYLKDPHFLCVNLADEYHLEIMKSDLNFMQANSQLHKSNGEIGFDDYELNKMQRLVNFASLPLDEEYRKIQLKDIYAFITEIDFRRNLDFKSLFPTFLSYLKKGEELSK